MIGGVCAGLGDFFSLDPTLIRLLFVLAFVFVQGTLLIYLVLLLIVPEEPGAMPAAPYQTPPSQDETKQQ
jgi:phage shock protein C